jgi:hypothetical protein
MRNKISQRLLELKTTCKSVPNTSYVPEEDCGFFNMDDEYPSCFCEFDSDHHSQYTRAVDKSAEDQLKDLIEKKECLSNEFKVIKVRQYERHNSIHTITVLVDIEGL